MTGGQDQGWAQSKSAKQAVEMQVNMQSFHFPRSPAVATTIDMGLMHLKARPTEMETFFGAGSVGSISPEGFKMYLAPVNMDSKLFRKGEFMPTASIANSQRWKANFITFLGSLFLLALFVMVRLCFICRCSPRRR